MKTAVSSYSLGRLVAEKRLAFLDIPAKAREMGFDEVEFSTFALPEGTTPLRFAPRVREACDTAGIAVTSYTIGADFLSGSKGDWAAEADRLKDEVRVAKILGAPRMRHDATRGFPAGHSGPRGFDDALPTLARGCRAVTEFAAEHGIRTTVENHGFFCQDSERVEKLMNAVGHPNFGALVDIGNFLCADEDPALAVARMAPYAFHVHVKDFHVKSGTDTDPGSGWFRSRGGNFLRGAIVGHGAVPVLQCLGTLKRAGYAGAVSLEFEGMEDPVVGVATGLANVKRFLAMLG